MEAVLRELDGDRVAVRTFRGDWSGRELLDRSAGAARFIERFAPLGTAVPALVGSTSASLALTVGGALSGRPIAPLGTRLAQPELVSLVKAIGASVLLADRANAELAGTTAAAAGAGVAVFDDFPPDDAGFVPTRPDSVVLVLHTSGTTGQPKPVSVSDEAIFHRAQAYREVFGLDGDDLYCSTGGFHHTGGVGMCFVAAACGAGVVPLTRFTVDAWRAVGELKPTCGLLVPTMIDMLLEEKALDAVPLRALQYGTAPIHPGTLQEALAALPSTRFTQAYGQTEGGPLTMLDHADHVRALHGEPALLASVGKPVGGVELRLEAPSVDGVGEVVARAGQVFLPGLDGWLHTGDLGRLDGEGYLFLHGRMGEKIIRGGENVYPLEVERVLETHDRVREAAVVGIDDRRWGQTIKAFVVPADTNHPPDVKALAVYVKSRLASFKVPTEWEFAAELPRNAAGKLLRHELP
jgi:acyl-CoA synthetase (AMP-forming)/AMP-acid ligase II